MECQTSFKGNPKFEGGFYIMIKVFSDGSNCKIEEGLNYMRINAVVHLRLGEKLNFIDGIQLIDGTFIQNMQYEMDAEIPTPGELAEKFKQFGAVCYYENAESKETKKISKVV